MAYQYKYRALIEAPLPDWGYHLKDFRTEYLEPIAKAFMWNLVRSTAFAQFPAWMSLEALREQLWSDHAHVLAGNVLNPNLSELKFGETSSPIAAAEYNRLVKLYRDISPQDMHDLIMSVGVGYVDYRLKMEQRMPQNAIKAIFATVVIDSWTAFEILVSDLWVTAVDNGPKDICARVFLSKHLRGGDDQITPKTIHKIEHNVKEQPGSWLREVGKVVFQRLDDIKLFYSEAFGKEVRKLFDEPEGRDILALSAFRNALVHNAGHADKKFVERVARFPEFREIKPKDELRLNGELVTRLRDAGKTLGQRLIQFVDNQLTPINDAVSDSSSCAPADI